MTPIRRTVLGIVTLAGGIAVCGGGATRAAETIAQVDARVIAINIPGASAIAQVGTFLGTAPVPPSFPFSCTLPSPIPGFMNGDCNYPGRWVWITQPAGRRSGVLVLR